jgi:hypothetical protein
MRVALATSAAAQAAPEFDDDERLAGALRGRGVDADLVRWDAAADWAGFELVVVRSTWDYTWRLDEFLEWASALGGRVRNAPEVLRWNSDKGYVGDLDAAGLPVVPTMYVRPGEALPELDGEVVVKPTVSAAGRDTGRFGPDAHDEARALLERLAEDRRVAMVQPYLGAVDEAGETALLFIAGELAHVLRKGAVLAPDEVAPVRHDALGAAEAMYDPELVVAGECSAAERDVAARIVDYVGDRFGSAPLYARVDLVPDASGDPLLMELELVEPNFYLNIYPDSAERIAEAIIGQGSDR